MLAVPGHPAGRDYKLRPQPPRAVMNQESADAQGLRRPPNAPVQHAAPVFAVTRCMQTLRAASM